MGYRTANASSKLPKFTFDSGTKGVIQAKLISRVKTWIVVLKKSASVKCIGAVLCNDLDLRAGVAPIFSRIRRRSDRHCFDRFLTRGDYCRAAPCLTVDTYTIDLETVSRNALPVCRNLDLIFCLEDGAV